MAAEAQPGQEFLMRDGSKITTLHDLLASLQKMDQQQFQSFVNPEKNDFANWVQHALHEDALAEKLRSTLNKDIIILKLAEKLDEKKAEQNLFMLAQTGTLRGQEEKPAQAYSPSETKTTVSLSLLQKKIAWKQIIAGMILGIFIGIFLGKLIAVWSGI